MDLTTKTVFIAPYDKSLKIITSAVDFIVEMKIKKTDF